MLVWQQSSHSSWMQNALKRLLKFVLIWCVFPYAIQAVRDTLEHLCHRCIYIHIFSKTLSRLVWKSADCVWKTSIHLVYILSMVILQITDTNNITEFVSVHVCAYVHATLTWPFTAKVAFLLDTPGASHFSPLSSSFRICSPLYDLFKFWARLNLPGVPAAFLHVRQVGLCVPGFRSRAHVFSHKFSH